MINLIKNKLEKQIELLEELEQAYSAEPCRYVVKYEYSLGDEKVYSLYDRDVDDIIKMDRYNHILSWLKVRNISDSQIKFIHNGEN